MDFKPLERSELQVFQALQDFPPPAQQSPAIVQRVAEILQASPVPEQELSQLKARAWSLYVDSRQDNRQIHIHQTYNISHSFNQDCWNDKSDKSTKSTTNTYEEPWWVRGSIWAFVSGSIFLILFHQAYLNDIRTRILLEDAYRESL